MSTKDTIAKLISIAEKQQKIIAKLAQFMPEPDSGVATQTADVSDAVVPYLQQAIAAVKAKPEYGVQSASLAENGELQMQILQPRAGDPAEYFAVKNKLKELLNGKNLKSADGKDLPVKMVNITGATA